MIELLAGGAGAATERKGPLYVAATDEGVLDGLRPAIDDVP